MALAETPILNREISINPPITESPFNIKPPCFTAVRKNGIVHTDYFFNTLNEGNWVISIDKQKFGSTSTLQDADKVCSRLESLGGEKDLDYVLSEGLDRDHKRTQRFLQANWKTVAKNLYPFGDLAQKTAYQFTPRCFVEVPINRVRDARLKITHGYVDLDADIDTREETNHGHVDLVGIGSRGELYIVEVTSKKDIEVEKDEIALSKGKDSLIRGGDRGKFKQVLDYDRGVRKYLGLGDEFVAIPLMVNYIPLETGVMKLAVRYAGNFPVV